MTSWAPSTAFERVVQALEAHGSRVTGNGRQRKATCPHHEDRTPSLSITDGESRVLVHCFVCDTDDVLAELRMARRDLFDEPRNAGDQPRRRVVAEYPYTTADGRLVFVKVRYMPKSFAVKRPDGRGGWAWGLAPDTPRVMYRLPRVLAARPSDVIWLVEGEKDVHALESAREIATCNFDGASGSGERPKWRAEYSPVLAGRDVLIVADRDSDGRTHAKYIATCLEGIARSCWIVEAASGKDAADHQAAGLGVSDFVRWTR